MIHVSHIPQRLGRWFVFTSISALVFYVVAGRFDLPMLNAYVGVLAATFLVASLFVDPDLMRERLRRGQTGADPRRLAVIRLLFVAFNFTLPLTWDGAKAPELPVDPEVE